MTHSLHGIHQQIHNESVQPAQRFLLISTVVEGEKVWLIQLWSSPSARLRLWTTRMKLTKLTVSEEVLGESIKDGYLHVSTKGELDDADNIKLRILPVDEEAMELELEVGDAQEEAFGLLDAAFDLLSRPVFSEKPDIRGLQAQISQKNDEIAALNAKLSSMKATVVRATGSDTRKKVVSPAKKAPANAGRLQPNAKRRKAVEDEFAGDDDSDDDDDE